MSKSELVSYCCCNYSNPLLLAFRCQGGGWMSQNHKQTLSESIRFAQKEKKINKDGSENQHLFPETVTFLQFLLMILTLFLPIQLWVISLEFADLHLRFKPKENKKQSNSLHTLMMLNLILQSFLKQTNPQFFLKTVFRICGVCLWRQLLESAQLQQLLVELSHNCPITEFMHFHFLLGSVALQRHAASHWIFQKWIFIIYFLSLCVYTPAPENLITVSRRTTKRHLF